VALSDCVTNYEGVIVDHILHMAEKWAIDKSVFRCLLLVTENTCYLHPLCLCLHVWAWLQVGGFLWFFILGSLMEICQEIQVWLKLGKNVRNFTWRFMFILLLETLNNHESAVLEFNGIKLLVHLFIFLSACMYQRGSHWMDFCEI